MLVKICRGSLLVVLLCFVGPIRPVEAKIRRDPENHFQHLDSLHSGKRPCLAHVSLSNLTEDVLTELAASSTHIFEATVTSQSPSDVSGLFGVNFRLKRSIKGDLISVKHLDYVRMTFYNSSFSLKNDSGDCPVAASLEPGKQYVIFSREIRNRQFVPLISPVPRSKAFVTQLKKYVCQKCGKTKSEFTLFRHMYIFCFIN